MLLNTLPPGVTMRRGLVASVGLVLALAVALVAPALASADRATRYVPDIEGRMFADSDGGWRDSARYFGLCVPGVTCPAVDGNYVARGGVDGPEDGFLRATQSGLTNLGIASSSVSIWRSPIFTYNGANGKAPDRVIFRIKRRVDLDEFLALPGTRARYRVVLFDHSGGEAINLISSRTVERARQFRLANRVVAPERLELGSRYSFRIITRFRYPVVGVLPEGHVDYDDVVLSAVEDTP